MNARLDGVERASLVIPLLGGAFFGLATFFGRGALAPVFGFSGNDPYVYRLAGSATFGYAVALALGVAWGSWTALRPVVVATLVFNLVSILACAVEIARGRAQPIVFAILATSIVISALTGWILARRPAAWSAERDVSSAVVGLVAVATLAATFFGILPQFVGVLAGLLGYTGTDPFVYRQAGAATLGYAAMGIVELRAPRWEAMTLPTVMALVFNGMSAVASALSILEGDATALTYLIGVAATFFTVAFLIVLVRRGR